MGVTFEFLDDRSNPYLISSLTEKGPSIWVEKIKIDNKTLVSGPQTSAFDQTST